ncbi:hypothetical protein CEP50_19440 [Actinopolyspora mortivallis]|uniref:Uncharacterized protein n=1 Tax=Actinopolyspora mortivallis TaxID=33906 RepID=A0A2T0GRE1_ACTMO|nr:hypothetical protein CEP50_19440 [Actinopolyspora mortivallis]
MWVLKSSKGSLKGSVAEPRVTCEEFEGIEGIGVSPRADPFKAERAGGQSSATTLRADHTGRAVPGAL